PAAKYALSALGLMFSTAARYGVAAAPAQPRESSWLRTDRRVGSGARTPPSRVLAPMNCQHDDLVEGRAEINCIGETAKGRSSDLAVDRREVQWILSYPRNQPDDRLCEVRPKSFALLLIPAKSLSE